MASSCKKGYYFCNTSQECKKIPRGHKVQSDGELVREYVSDWRSDLDEKYAVNFKVDGSGYNVDAKVGNATVFSKSRKRTTKGTTPKHALDKALIAFNNEDDPARNLPGMKNEELQGGVSVEPYTKDTKFLEVETVDIIKPKALNASDWRSDLEVVDEGVGKIASKIIKNPSVKKFVGNLSKKSPIKVLGRSGTPKKAAYNPNLTLKPHESPGAARDIITKSQGATMKGGVKNTTWKSDSKWNWGSIKNPVKVYKQPTYAKPGKYPGDKTGAYARELARQDNTVRIGKRGRISKDGLKLDPSKQGFANTVGGKTKLNPARGLEDKTIEFLKKFKESYSYEADLENMIIEILEENINMLHNDGFTYEEIAEFYDVKEELLNEGLIKGAIDGAKIIGKYAPKIAKFATERGIKDRKILTQFVKNPKNWQRANTDIQKVIDAPKNTYNLGKSFRQFADKGYKALKGGAQKLIEPIKKKGQVDRAKYKKYQDLVNRANRLAKSKEERLGKIVDVAPNTTNLPQANKSLPLTKNVTKDMSPSDIRHQGMKLLNRLQKKNIVNKNTGETQGQVLNRMSNAVDSSKKSTTYSGKVDAAKNLPDPGAIVKSSSSAITAVKPSLDTTKGINMSLSSMASKVKNLLTGKKSSKQITGSTKPKELAGTKTPKVLTGTKTKQLELPISTKKKFNPAKAVKNTVVGVTGAAVGSNLLKKDKTTAIDPPNENKAIVDTEKKKVDPQKNPVVSKVVDTYKTGKETKSKDLNPWGRSKQYTAKDGTVVDRSDVFTKAAFDFGPNIKKGQKIGVITHGQRKKYDLEATRRKSVKESAALVQQLPKGFKAASKLKDVVKSKAIQKVFGAAMTGIGASGMVSGSKRDAEIPRDKKGEIDTSVNPPKDIQRQMDTTDSKPRRIPTTQDLKDLVKRAGKKDDIGAELDVKQNQAKDAEKFSDFDKEMSAIKKALDAGNITKKEAAKRRLQAGKDRPKN
tara:strand:+ start:1 stop:2931 length:2931 start_codon:yes stop_codon:yes gene_type:complete